MIVGRRSAHLGLAFTVEAIVNSLIAPLAAIAEGFGHAANRSLGHWQFGEPGGSPHFASQNFFSFQPLMRKAHCCLSLSVSEK